MAYNSILSVVLSLLVLHYQSCHVTSENKPGTINTYCGEQFISVWSVCCGNNPSCENSKRQIQEKDFLMSSTLAKRFLESPKHQYSSLISKRAATDAVEECCIEGCSLSEIAEYQCIS